MSLQPREKIIVGGGLALVLIVGLVRFGGGLLGGGAAATSIGGMLDTIKAHQELEQKVSVLASDLGLDLPRSAPSEQATTIQSKLQELAGAQGVIIRSLRRSGSAGSGKGKVETALDFQLELAGVYDGFVKFINALETAPMGFRVEEFALEPAGPPGPDGKPGPAGDPMTGNVSATMKVKAYVFARVFLEAKPVEKKPEMTPAPAAAAATPETGAVSMPQAGPPPGVVISPPVGAVTPAAAAATSTAPKRKTIRMDGREMVIDYQANTVTVDGKAIPVSPQEMDAKMNQLPPGAQVTEE